MKNTEPRANEPTRVDRGTPRISFGGTRWGSRPGKPRLVTFSWAAVTPSMTRR